VTDQSRNVELVIRAKNLSKKTLTDVQKEIESISKALDDQVDASKRGEGSLKDLEKSYGKLEDAMKSLLQQQAVIKTFEAQRARLEDLQKAQAAATAKLTAHQEALAKTEKVTKRQTAQLATYEKAVTRSTEAVDKQAIRVANAGKAAEELGVDLNDLVGSQDRVLESGRKLSTQYDKQAAAVENFAIEAKLAATASKEFQAAADFTKAAERAAELNRAGQYVQFWTEQLDKMDAAQRRASNSEALNLMADRAIAAARGYRTLGDASKKLIQENDKVGKSLREILDPAAAARSSLGGVEEEIRQVNQAAISAAGPITDYRAQVQALAATNKALAAQGSGIDLFQRQVTALREARAEFVKNRTALTQYAATVREAEAPTAEMAAELKRLESALASSAASYRTQAAAARTTQTTLREGGIATNDLAGAQARLVTAAKGSTQALANLNTAAEKYGTSVKKAEDNTSSFENNGRTALSFVQRLRGEVLALAAAYVGLQGGIGLANDSLNASNSKRAIQNQLALTVGDDPAKIAKEYAYIRAQADRIGVSFEAAAKGYAKFAAAASLAGRSIEEIRYVSEAFQEVGVVAGLTADDMGGVFKALEQIYSKGKIQAEELRGQLGDRLFGAFEIAAKALKDQFPDLDKAMQKGLITSEQLLAIAEEYRKTVANRLPTSMESLTANQNRLNSAFFDFKVLIADSGFATEYEKLVIKLSAFLRSDDGTKLAQNLSKAFAAISTGLTFLLDHLDELTLALELAFGIKALSLVAGLASTITTKLIPALALAQAELLATGVAGASAATVITTAFAAVVALFAGWKIGEYLYDQFDIAKRAGISMAEVLKGLTVQLTYAFNAFATSIGGNLKGAFNDALNYLKDGFDGVLDVLAKGAEAVGKNDIAASIRKGMTDGTRAGATDIKGELAKLKKEFEDEMELNTNMFALQRANVGKDRVNYPNPANPDQSGPTGKPTLKPKPADPDADAAAQEKLVKKRISLADQLTRALEGAEAKIQKNEKDSLESRLMAIDTEYAKIFRKIDELAKLPGGKAGADTMRTQLGLYVSLLKEQERVKFAMEEQKKTLADIKDSETRINELIALRTQLLQNVEAQRKMGGLTDQEAKEQVATIDANYVPQINAATQATLQLAEANKAAFGDTLAYDNFIAKLNAIPASLKQVRNELITTAQVNDKIAGGMADAFGDFVSAAAQGENAIEALRDSFLQFAADFLKEIAMMIVKQIILNLLQNSSIGGFISGGVNGVAGGASGGGSSVQASQRHSGGMAGGAGVTRSANADWFNNAPSYGDQGIIGLKANEYPTILKKNEEVLSESNPRNMINGGGDGAAAPSGGNMTVINQIDSLSVVEAGLSTPAGDKVFMNRIRANKSSIKSMLT
jgi:tape measure domain-containing protein